MIFTTSSLVRIYSLGIISVFALTMSSEDSYAQTKRAKWLAASMSKLASEVGVHDQRLKSSCAELERVRGQLEIEILSLQPELTELNAQRTALSSQLKLDEATLKARTEEHQALVAAVASLEDSIKNFNQTSSQRLTTLYKERDAAKQAAKKAARDLDNTIQQYEKWKATVNSITLDSVFRKVIAGQPLTQDEQTILSIFDGFSKVNVDLMTLIAAQEAIITQKDKDIADLLAGKKTTISELQKDLALKKEAQWRAHATTKEAYKTFSNIQRKVQRVETRIAALSNIQAPTTPVQCPRNS